MNWLYEGIRSLSPTMTNSIPGLPSHLTVESRGKLTRYSLHLNNSAYHWRPTLVLTRRAISLLAGIALTKPIAKLVMGQPRYGYRSRAIMVYTGLAPSSMSVMALRQIVIPAALIT